MLNDFFNGAAAAAGGYEIERSLRFNSSDSAYLGPETFSSPTSTTAWTWAGWIKKTLITTSTDYRGIFTARSASDNYAYLDFSDNGIRFANRPPSGTIAVLQTTPVFRDPSAWFHLVFVFDSSNATSTDTLRLYINGTRITTFSSATYPSASQASVINSAVSHYIGYDSGNTAYLDGYLADVHFIDGQALDPTSFGEFDDNGIWQPIEYGGTFPGNSFHLPFSDNSTTAALGDDTSGNNNDFTVNNISVQRTFRSATLTNTGGSTATLNAAADMFDGNTATNFYCEPVNPSSLTLTLASGFSFTTLAINGYVQGSSKIVINGVDVSSQLLTDPNTDRTITGVSSPFTTLYMEVTGSASIPVIREIKFDGASPGWIFTPSDPNDDSLVDVPQNGTETDTGAGGEVRGNYCTLNPLDVSSLATSNGNLDLVATNAGYVRGTMVASGKFYWEVTISAAGLGGIIGVMQPNGALPYTNSNGYHSGGNQYVNGSSVGAWGASWTTGDVIGIAIDAAAGTITAYKNGSSQGSKSISTTAEWMPWIHSYSGTYNTNFGQRAFAYSAPSGGYKALCTSNLPTPTIADGSDYMDVVTRAGGGTTQTFTVLRPGLVWEKRRETTSSHYLFDVNRGNDNYLSSNTTSAEGSSAGAFTFNTNSYTVSSGFDWPSGASVVDWAWDAGSSTVSNTDGSITSSVRANPSAGFSIATFTKTATTNETIGHGLGVAPSMIIVKTRQSSGYLGWAVYHTSTGSNGYLELNTTSAFITLSSTWNNSSPTSSVFSMGTGWTATQNMVAYCFAPVEGYSAFGSYTGNVSTDGPFVFTGFRPRWIMIKNSSASGDSWVMHDTARNTYNVVDALLMANQSTQETTSTNYYHDILSNGFKLRTALSAYNSNGATYIYAAFAENPFALNARAR